MSARADSESNPVPNAPSPTPREAVRAVPADPELLLRLAFRLVVARQATTDLLENLSATSLCEKIRSASPNATTPAALVQLEQLLSSSQPGIEPNALWLAWMKSTQGPRLSALALEVGQYLGQAVPQ